MEKTDKRFVPSIPAVADFVFIPRSEYDDLRDARLCLDLLARSMTRFGVNDHIADAVFRHFGYKASADFDAEMRLEDANA